MPDLSWESRFVDAWPVVERRVIALVVARGTRRDEADDVAQEVAMRAYRSRPTFATADELFWWCSTVARHFVIDEHRKQRRVTTMAMVPDRAAPDSTEERYERQQLLGAVLARLVQLPEAQRAALVRVSAAADYVRRHRARRQLLAIVKAFGAIAAWMLARCRAIRRAAPVAGATLASMLVLGGVTTWWWHDHEGLFPPPAVPAVAEPPLWLAPQTTTPPAHEPARPSSTSTSFNLDRVVVHHISTPTPAGELTAGVRPNEPGSKLMCAWSDILRTSVCIDYPKVHGSP